MPLYPVRKPINKESQTKKSRAQFYAEQKQALKRRCGGRCEGCGVSLYKSGGDCDHVWGRAGTGAGLGWPFCDHVSALAALCRSCHNAKTDERDPNLLGGLRRRSIDRMVETYTRDGPPDWVSLQWDLIGMARRIIDDAKADGWADRLLGNKE